MRELKTLQQRYSKESFLLYLIEKQKYLREAGTRELNIKLTPQIFLKNAHRLQAQNDLMCDIFDNLPLEVREEIARIKTRNDLW